VYHSIIHGLYDDMFIYSGKFPVTILRRNAIPGYMDPICETTSINI